MHTIITSGPGEKPTLWKRNYQPNQILIIECSDNVWMKVARADCPINKRVYKQIV